MSSLYTDDRIAGSVGVQRRGRFVGQVMWWAVFLICLFYAGYAFVMAGVEIAYRMGIAADAPHRSIPLVFVLHAVTGGIVLITGALQFNRRILQRNRPLHRLLGRIYVGTIWISSIGGLWLTIAFDVSLAAKIVLGLVAILWFSTTSISLWHVRQRRIAAHREWMLRSFSLSLFFVTFSLWVPGLASTRLPEAMGYPLAIFLSWSLNLLVAEGWIRYSRPAVGSIR